MARQRVLIGIPQPKDIRRPDGKYKAKIGNAGLGFVHEFGSPHANIPARPFLVPGVREAGPACAAILKESAGVALLRGEGIEKGLEKAGLRAVSYVKRRITGQVGFQPLKAGTIAARERDNKKGTKALIRTGQLLNSITYVVRSHGG